MVESREDRHGGGMRTKLIDFPCELVYECSPPMMVGQIEPHGCPHLDED
jgi:hypothetical protein